MKLAKDFLIYEKNFDAHLIKLFGIPIFKKELVLDKKCYSCIPPCFAQKKYTFLKYISFVSKQKELAIEYVEFYVLNSFFKNFDKDDSRIIHFLSGFDADSKKFALFVIDSIEKLKNNICFDVNIFDKKTSEEQRDILEEFYKNIKKLDDGTLQYKNYIMKSGFSTSVFIGNHSLDNLVSKNSIDGKAVIDVGGYIGDSAIVLRKNFPNSAIYSFEALPENCTTFRETMELNNIYDINLVQLALGDSQGKTFISDSASSSAIQDEKNDSNIEVTIDTLDNYIEANLIESVGLIKVDIEGFEQSFLKGALNTIKKHKPALLLSIYHNWDDFLEIKPLIENLNLGYTFKLVKPVDGNLFLETLLVCECIS